VKVRAAQLMLFLVLAAMVMFISGCATDEPDNASVRPWNSPEGWEGGMMGSMLNDQHR